MTRHYAVPLADGVTHVVDAVIEDDRPHTSATGYIVHVFECGAQARVGLDTILRARRREFAVNCIACIALAARRGHEY